MKKSVLFSVLTLTSVLCADGDLVAASKKMNGKSQPKMNNDKMMSSIVTLTSARPESDNGWYLFGDVLYWHASVGNADWAERHVSTSNSDTYNVHQLDFKWSWGFKAGVGVNMDHDMWDTNVCFTWFETSNSNAIGLLNPLPANANSQQVATLMPPQADVSSSKHHWSIHFGMFDWELGRWQYSSKKLALRPHVGVKGGWINQKRTTHTTFHPANNQVDNGHFANDFWGVGPSVGVNTMWVLGNTGNNMEHRFCLFGDAAGALMYGHFHNSFAVPSKVAGSNETLKFTHLDRNLAVPMLQAMMGFSWDTGCNINGCHFTFKVGYEFQYWFRQNQYVALKETPSTNTLGAMRYSDDLALQGVTGEFRFDF